MRPALVVLVILIVLLLAAEVMIKLLAKKYMDQMAECLYKKDLAAFDALTGKKLVQLTVPPFNFHYMRLQRYYMVNDEKNIEKIFEMFDQVKLNGQQKTEVLVNGFQYYLNKKNKIAYILSELVTSLDIQNSNFEVPSFFLCLDIFYSIKKN